MSCARRVGRWGEICSVIGCSKASASVWCRDVEIDGAVLAERRRARRLTGNDGARQRRPNRLQRRKQAEIDEGNELGSRLIGDMNARDLRIAAVALHAGEGSKTDGAVKFANSDPRMVALFLAWLRAEFDIDEARLRVNLYLHEGLDLDAAIRFWSEVTGDSSVPVHQAVSSATRSVHPPHQASDGLRSGDLRLFRAPIAE